MKLRTSVVITTNELEGLLYAYVTGDLVGKFAGANQGAAMMETDDVSCQLRFDDDVEGAIVDIYTADPITTHDDREGTG